MGVGMADELILAVCDCGKTLKVKPSYAGKKVRCPSCNAGVLIDSLPSAAEKSPDTNRSGAMKPASEKRDTNQPVTGKPAKDAFSFLQGGQPSPAPAKPVIDIKLDVPAKAAAKKEKTPKAPIVVDALGESDAAKLKSASKQLDTAPAIAEKVDGTIKSPILPPAMASATSTTGEIPDFGSTTPPPGKTGSDPGTGTGSSGDRQPRQYPTLDLIRMLYRVFAYIVMAGSLLMALVSIGLAVYQGGSNVVIGIISAVPILVGGAIGGATMLAVSEGIKLLLDIQDNTHRSADQK
ncbi:hypothetical protein Poly59_27540 [Rubripirellula reticaptiva]|uniref:Uncharacterized protein n=2 Tax=Rubripirellula reticaptiva TaxID=2528013 RepID=A0A5C6ES34_9BACT|nr:hypothetical protein Poly59_27540 [Rubripirellula reticaptiva]